MYIQPLPHLWIDEKFDIKWEVSSMFYIGKYCIFTFWDRTGLEAGSRMSKTGYIGNLF